MSTSEATSDRRWLGATLAVFLTITLVAAIDIGSDLATGTRLTHVVLESLTVALGLLGAIWVGRTLRETVRARDQAHREAQELNVRLAASEAQAADWRAQARGYLEGLGAAIDTQLGAWGLTRAEKEVALLLLKGFSHKEIAQHRAITEATARQQAASIYRKAGLAGRNELAAFFLEDLLLPQDQRQPPP